MTANLMNCWVKRGHRVKAEDLIGREPGAGPRVSDMTPEERQAWAEERRQARAAKAPAAN